MKAEHYYKQDLREGMISLFLKWWRGEEMTKEDRIHYYSLKTDFCKSKSKDYNLLEMNACAQQTFYEYKLMGINPHSSQPSKHQSP